MTDTFRHNEIEGVRVPKLNRLEGRVGVLESVEPTSILILDGGDASTIGPYAYSIDGGDA